MSELTIQNERMLHIVIACSQEQERRDIEDRLAAQTRRLLLKDARDWSELKDLLGGESVDVVLIAMEVGGVSGIEINRNIKMLYRDPPATILLTDKLDVHQVIKAFRCGFADCLPLEGIRETELREAISRAAGLVAASRQQAQHVRDLERQAQRDSVTGLANRYYLRERLNQLIETARRHNVPFAAIQVRVDNLEHIRVSFGNKVGDAVLLAFGKRLQAASRKSATFGRLNDDTFLYLVEQDVTEAGVAGACNRLASALTFPLDLDAVSLSLSASVAAGRYPEDGTTIAEILQAAETGVLRQRAAADDGDAAAPDRSAPTVELRASPDPMRASPTGGGAAAGAVASGDGIAEGPTHSAPTEAMPAATLGATRFSDRRDAVRRRCLKRGLLVFNNGFSTVNCLIRDLSETGARVEVDGTLNTLEAFELRLVESGIRYKVERRWQSGNKYGLRFLV